MKLTNPINTIYKILKLSISNNLGINLMGNQIENILNFKKISALVATAGQPTEQQLPLIKNAGYQIVINLTPSNTETALPNEKTIVESLDLEYVHIPVIAKNPNIEDFERFCNIMQTNPDKPVFVHCSANLRVSAFMYLYCRIYEKIDKEQAQKELHHLWIPSETWQHFFQQVMESHHQFISPDIRQQNNIH